MFKPPQGRAEVLEAFALSDVKTRNLLRNPVIPSLFLAMGYAQDTDLSSLLVLLTLIPLETNYTDKNIAESKTGSTLKVKYVFPLSPL